MALFQVLPILLRILALGSLTGTCATTAFITHRPSLSALDNGIQGPRKRAIESLSIQLCASSCFNSAVTKSTTCDLGDWECECQPANENIIVDVARGCVNNACGNVVGDSVWSEAAEFCSSLNDGDFGFSTTSSLATLNTGPTGMATAVTGLPSTGGLRTSPTFETTTTLQTPPTTAQTPLETATTTQPGVPQSPNMNGGEIAGTVAGVVGAIAGVIGAYYGGKSYSNRHHSQP